MKKPRQIVPREACDLEIPAEFAEFQEAESASLRDQDVGLPGEFDRVDGCWVLGRQAAVQTGFELQHELASLVAAEKSCDFAVDLHIQGGRRFG